MDDCFNGYKVNLYDMFYGLYNIIIIPMAILIGISYSLCMSMDKGHSYLY